MTEAHLYDLIAQYNVKKKELDALHIYTGYDDFSKRENEGERKRIVDAMKRIETEIRIVTKKEYEHLLSPSIDITIANIKQNVEPPAMPEMAWEFNPGR